MRVACVCFQNCGFAAGAGRAPRAENPPSAAMSDKSGSKRPRAEEDADDALTPEEEAAIAAAEQEPYPWEYDSKRLNDSAHDWETRRGECLHLSEADIARGPRRGIKLSEYEKKCAVDAHRARLALRRKIEVDAWIHEAEPLAPAEVDARWRNAIAERTTEQCACERARRLVALSHGCPLNDTGMDQHMQYMKAILFSTPEDNNVGRALSEVADKIGEVSTSIDTVASATSDVANEIKDREDLGEGLSEGLQAVARSVDGLGELYERLK